MITADQAAQKWAQNLQSAGKAYTDGINSVKVSPAASAAQNIQGYVNGVMAAVNSGKLAQGLSRVTLQGWQQACIQKGAQRLGAGATAAQPKMLAFLQQFLPVVANVQATVKQMDASTYEARKARANAMMDGLHAFKRS